MVSIPFILQTLDNFNLKDYNIQWLRLQIGVVSQEPILFDTRFLQLYFFPQMSLKFI